MANVVIRPVQGNTRVRLTNIDNPENDYEAVNRLFFDAREGKVEPWDAATTYVNNDVVSNDERVWRVTDASAISSTVAPTEVANTGWQLLYFIGGGGAGAVTRELVSITLTTAAQSALGWGGSTAGTITNVSITEDAFVYLNGVLLTETIDYTVAGTVITLSSDIRSAIEDSDRWCLSVVDNVGGGGGGGTTPTAASQQTFNISQTVAFVEPNPPEIFTNVAVTADGIFTFASETDAGRFFSDLGPETSNGGFVSTVPTGIIEGITLAGIIPSGTTISLAGNVVTTSTTPRAIGNTTLTVLTGVREEGRISNLIELPASAITAGTGNNLILTIPNSDATAITVANNVGIASALNRILITNQSDDSHAFYRITSATPGIAGSTDAVINISAITSYSANGISGFEGRTPAFSFTVPTTGTVEVFSVIDVQARDGKFTSLNDTPSTYTGSANQQLRVNATATGIEFFEPAAEAGTTIADDTTGTLNTVAWDPQRLYNEADFNALNITPTQTVADHTYSLFTGTQQIVRTSGIGTILPREMSTFLAEAINDSGITITVGDYYVVSFPNATVTNLNGALILFQAGASPLSTNLGEQQFITDGLETVSVSQPGGGDIQFTISRYAAALLPTDTINQADRNALDLRVTAGSQTVALRASTFTDATPTINSRIADGDRIFMRIDNANNDTYIEILNAIATAVEVNHSAKFSLDNSGNTLISNDMRHVALDPEVLNSPVHNELYVMSAAGALFAQDVVRITGTVAGFSLNAGNEINGDYSLQANTNKYLSGANDNVVTAAVAPGPYFWYSERRNISLVATDATGTNENWRLVAGHWVNDAQYNVGNTVSDPGFGTTATAGTFVAVGSIFPLPLDDLQVPAGILDQTVVGGGGIATSVVIRGFDPAFIDRHFQNHPLIETDEEFTIRTDLIGTVESFVFTADGYIRLPQETPVNDLDVASKGYVDGRVSSNLVNRLTPTGTITFTQAEIDALDSTQNTILRNVMVNNQEVAAATVTAVAGGGLSFDYTVTLDTRVAGWAFASATQSGNDLPFTLVVGQTHEWTASFNSGQVTGDLVINVADLSAETGVFYVDPMTMDEFRLNHIPATTGLIETLGFQTEEDAAGTFQAQSPDDPYVVTSDLASYATTTALETAVPITITRGLTFPTAPVNGDEHYLTTNIWPGGTSFTSQAVNVDASAPGVQALVEHRVLDPEIQQMVVAGTTEVTLINRPNIAERDLILPGGTGTTFYRGFVRDRSYNGIHVTRTQVVGTTTHTTTVAEVRYSLTDVSTDGGTTRSQLTGAFIHDYTYRLQTTSPVGSVIVTEVHYYVITFANGGSIGTLLTEANAVTSIEGFIQDSSSLPFALTTGSATPTEFPTTSAFTAITIRATFASGFFTDHRYRFIPMNDFAIDTNVTNTNIGGTAVTLEADGSVNNFQPASSIMPWAVRFTRTFAQVPPMGTMPTFVNGPHVFQTTWRRLDYDNDSVIGNVDTGLSEREDNLNLFVSAATVASGFGTLPANSGTAGWIHNIQVNGQSALRIDASAVTHAADADYEFNYTALNGWSLAGNARDTTSRALRYNGPDLVIPITGPNGVYATDARIEILKDIIAASTDFNDFQNKVTNLQEVTNEQKLQTGTTT